MSGRLRFALVTVTLSLFATLVWLATADHPAWTVVRRATLAGFDARWIADRNTDSSKDDGRPPATPHGTSPRTTSDEEAASASTAARKLHSIKALHQPVLANRSAQRSDDPGEQTKRPVSTASQEVRSSVTDHAFVPTPDESTIRLTASTAAQDRSMLERTSKGINLIVRNKDVTYVFDMLNSTGQVKIVALPSVRGPITLTLYDTTVEQALDAILKMRGYLSRRDGDYTLVYTPDDLDALEAEAGKIEVFTYKPRYIAANDLVQVLTPHLSEKGRISNTKANQIGIAANSDNAGGDSLAVEDAVVVQDVQSAVTRIKAIIAEVDVRPPQVLIEAVLLSVELNDEHRMGVNFALLSHTQLAVVGNGASLNASAGFPPSSLVTPLGKVQGGFASNEHGLKYGVIRGSFTAFIDLLETIGHTTVVASPKVLALNKQRAEIIVGSQLGYRTVTTTETAAVENVQFLDVGTQLRMRPFVQADGRIRMELHPEKSSGQVSETTGLPEKNTTQVTTNLTIRDGETIVIGGLIEEQQQRTVQQVPFFGSLPVVGRAFRDETTTTARHEIIVLITPRIIHEDEEFADAAEQLEQFSRRRSSLERSFPKYTRLALSRKYYDRACAAHDAGDLKTAREMIDLSLFFDPTNDRALDLWQELHSLRLDEVEADDLVLPRLQPASSEPATNRM